MRASSCAFRCARTASGSFGPRMAGVPGCSLSALWMLGRGFSFAWAVIMLSAEACTPVPSPAVVSTLVVGAACDGNAASAMAEMTIAAEPRDMIVSGRRRRMDA
jgi:hypothetical protein